MQLSSACVDRHALSMTKVPVDSKGSPKLVPFKAMGGTVNSINEFQPIVRQFSPLFQLPPG